MKEITLRVPDQKVEFVLELIEQLGLETIDNEYEIPEEHKAIVRERLKLIEKDPSRLVKWEDVKDSFRLE